MRCKLWSKKNMRDNYSEVLANMESQDRVVSEKGGAACGPEPAMASYRRFKRAIMPIAGRERRRLELAYAMLTVLYVGGTLTLSFTPLFTSWILPLHVFGEWALLQATLLASRRFQRGNWKRTVEDAILDWAVMRLYLGWLTIDCIQILGYNLYLGSAVPGYVLNFLLYPVEAIMFDYFRWGIFIANLAWCCLVIDVLEGRTNRAYMRSLRIATLFGLGWSFYRVVAGHADLRRKSKFDGGIARLVKIFTETCYSASEDDQNSRCRTIVAWQAPERRRFGALDAREFITRTLSKSWIYDGDAYAASPITNAYVSAFIYVVNVIAFGTSGKGVGPWGPRVIRFTWDSVMETVEGVGITFFLVISLMAIMFPKTTRAHLTYKVLLVDSRSAKGWGAMFWGVSAEEVNACVEEVGPDQLQLWRSGTGWYMGPDAIGGSSETGVDLHTRKKYLNEKWGHEFSAGLIGEVMTDAPGEPIFYVGKGSRRLEDFHDEILVGGLTCAASDR